MIKYDYPKDDAPEVRRCARCKKRVKWPLYWIDVRDGARVCDDCAYADVKAGFELSTG